MCRQSLTQTYHGSLGTSNPSMPIKDCGQDVVCHPISSPRCHLLHPASQGELHVGVIVVVVPVFGPLLLNLEHHAQKSK